MHTFCVSGGDRLNNFTVALSNHGWPPDDPEDFLPPNLYATCAYFPGTSSNGAIHNMTCQSQVYGVKVRYVYIIKWEQTAQALTLCEVEIISRGE